MENLFSKAFLSADDLMKVSWKMFQERFFKFLYIFLLAIVAFLFSATVLLALALFSSSSLVTFICLFLIFVALLVITLIQNIMFFEIVKNKNVRIRQAFRRALPKVRPYLGSLAIYLLVALNLIFLFAFLGVFIFMSAIFVSLFAFAQSFSIMFGIMAAFLIFFIGVVLMVLFLFAYVWQYFLFFDVVINDMPVREALDHSFFLVSNNKQGVFERVSIFFLCYILILLTLTVLSYINSIFSAATEVANYILGGWGVLFLYTMYENLRAISPSKADTSSRQAVSLFLKSGSVIVATFTLLAIFSCVFFLIQINVSGVVAEAYTLLQYSLSNL